MRPLAAGCGAARMRPLAVGPGTARMRPLAAGPASPHLLLRLREGFSARPGVLRAKREAVSGGRGEGAPQVPAPPPAAAYLEAGPVRGRRCRAAPLTIRAASARSRAKLPLLPLRPLRLRERWCRLAPGWGRPRPAPAARRLVGRPAGR